jgi:hypothetical protein
MLYSERKNIDDLIVENLSKRPNITGPELLDLIKKHRPATTKQAMYYALGYLLEAEVVVKVGTGYSISNIWRLKIQNNLIKDSSDLQSILRLNEGESISLKFPSLITADFYWAHVFTELTDWVPENTPIFIWNPHEWFVIGREAVERAVLENFTVKNKKVYFSISGSTALDKDFRKAYTSANLSINTGAPAIFPNHIYVNVFKNILVEVFLSKELVKEIDHFYETHQVAFGKLTAEEQNEFISIVSKKYPVRIKVSKNTKKSAEIKNKLAKGFIIPKGFVV